MSGKPAARQGDATMKGGPIVQGSAGVMIGAPTGVACSVCPGGVVRGNPVNPLLGAKVFPGETDIALPGPLPFVLSRSYSSYRTRTPAPVGIFGSGWKAPSDIYLQLHDDQLILNDNGGRSIHFDPLLPGETAFSRTESFWLARGGVLNLYERNPLSRLWQALPEAVRLSPHVYLATNSPQGPWWLLGWSAREPRADEILPAPLPPYRVLTGLVDNFGRTLSFQRDASGEFAGHITGVTDGAGRRFRLVLSTQAQRAEHHSSSFPDTLPDTAYGADSGIRLNEVWLTHDPLYPENLPALPLARYDWSPRGELSAVYDRSGTLVRTFAYDDDNPGRMVDHCHTGRPESRYRYDAAGRVTEQHSPEGLSYRFEYEKDRVTITDSLNRREVLHTSGEGGMKRVVRQEHADGSTLHSEYDVAGRLLAQTDAAGRRTQYRLDPASGQPVSITTPDGRQTTLHYSQRQLTSTVYPDGLRSRQEYDEAGRLTLSTQRDGDTTRYLYDDPHSEYPSASEDSTGSRRQMVWSRYGQLLSLTDCSGYETKYEYDRFGQLTALHQEEGLSQYRTYDTRGRLVSLKDAQDRETQYDYNDAGDLIAEIPPDGSRRAFIRDARGQLLGTEQDGLTRQMEYDAAGRVIQLTNENGSRTTFTYDVMDRLTQESGFDGRTQHYQYDLTGRLTRSEDEGLVTLWHYDAADRLTHRTVNNEPAEQWEYNDKGWLRGISHLCDGHRITVMYAYDSLGRRVGERLTVQQAGTEETLWQHETQYARNAGGLLTRMKPDGLPVVEWLTYGSGHLAGLKLGDTPLLEFTRDRLHRETQRRFGRYELTTAYSPGGQLQSHSLNDPFLDREYIWARSGKLARISGRYEQRDYQYGEGGRLFSTGIQSTHIHEPQWTVTDPAGNRSTAYVKCPSQPDIRPDNRIHEDTSFRYYHDAHGRLTEKHERYPHANGPRTHHYRYDNQHRLTGYELRQNGYVPLESHYLYDPLGRRIRKEVRTCKQLPDGTSTEPELKEVVWYGWEGDRLTTSQSAQSRVQTVYQPGSFTPLLRIETTTEEMKKAQRRTLAEKLQQDSTTEFVAELVAMLNRLERELQADQISPETRQWLASCGLTAEQMKQQVEPLYTPKRSVYLYHCDHRGLPLALINDQGKAVWRGEYYEWGTLWWEEGPDDLQQLLRLPGQQYDRESGLFYNRHRYYSPFQGRYITQDPIGLRGGWNAYVYPLDPIRYVDPLGLEPFTGMNMGTGVSERASLGQWMAENGATPNELSNAMAPFPPSNPMSRECRASATAALGSGVSGTISANEKTGEAGVGSIPTAAVAARASLTCGLKFRDPESKDLKAAAGFSVGLGIVSIEITQTSTWPELYIGAGLGAGPEIKIPYNPNVSIPLF